MTEGELKAWAVTVTIARNAAAIMTRIVENETMRLPSPLDFEAGFNIGFIAALVSTEQIKREDAKELSDFILTTKIGPPPIGGMS